ncbi:hypothetical protein ACFFUB_10250 [Algimonas porphyrae]|uniref:Uncharacterized protein n=1 Tax=Algimonas porphyrae TaxID=1128113 RepID=A0ABQ5V354_9PROT|nr:hypothetical protein [Algimonas porphyrae]GLQ21505.1 hypothetical protein GCM10007854_24600 [Algimonas porphyrae]
MASYALPSATPTPVFTTESRNVRTDDTKVPVEQAVDASPESRKIPDPITQPALFNPIAPDAAPKKEVTSDVLSDVRPVIETLDGTKDIVGTLESEEPDQADNRLQASGAYQALRQPDEASRTPVGTA